MTEKQETSDTLLPLPVETKKALRMEAVERETSMGEAGAQLITERLQEIGRLPKSSLPKTRK